MGLVKQRITVDCLSNYFHFAESMFHDSILDRDLQESSHQLDKYLIVAETEPFRVTRPKQTGAYIGLLLWHEAPVPFL